MFYVRNDMMTSTILEKIDSVPVEQGDHLRIFDVNGILVFCCYRPINTNHAWHVSIPGCMLTAWVSDTKYGGSYDPLPTAKHKELVTGRWINENSTEAHGIVTSLTSKIGRQTRPIVAGSLFHD